MPQIGDKFEIVPAVNKCKGCFMDSNNYCHGDFCEGGGGILKQIFKNKLPEDQLNKQERITHNVKAVEKVIDKHRQEFSAKELKYIADRLSAIIREAGIYGQTKTD